LTRPYEYTPTEVVNDGTMPPPSYAQAQAQVSPRVTRPAASVAGLIAAASGLAGAAVTFVAGKSLLRDTLGLHPGGKAADLIDGADHVIQTRAIVAVVVGVLLVALAIGVRGGRTSVRIGLTLCLLAAMGGWLLNLRDSGVPGPIRGLDAVAMLFSLSALTFTWLPGSRQAAGTGR
jgi:hypothetical protein